MRIEFETDALDWKRCSARNNRDDWIAFSNPRGSSRVVRRRVRKRAIVKGRGERSERSVQSVRMFGECHEEADRVVVVYRVIGR